ncbi:hypothetical protein SAMN02745119_02003 [Trichlorobacter thiogenes]|uniref:Uncharacterized protein n=1 Tax=Trichlorobacter thiogenes TaxID=115783 RepID=A0A1T4PL04_9BACT|nr:hypothetical protein [Trichlorobacter thiogenes]SJZ91926.1 hypothetical protein SAMN02745119_02003 [Trichlorobacter thiogenes]
MFDTVSDRLQQLSYKHAILRLALVSATKEGMQEFENEALAMFAINLETETRSIIEQHDKEMEQQKGQHHADNQN